MLILGIQLILASLNNIIDDNYILTILMAISTLVMGIFTSYLVYKTIKFVKRSKKKKNKRDWTNINILEEERKQYAKQIRQGVLYEGKN